MGRVQEELRLFQIYNDISCALAGIDEHIGFEAKEREPSIDRGPKKILPEILGTEVGVISFLPRVRKLAKRPPDLVVYTLDLYIGIAAPGKRITYAVYGAIFSLSHSCRCALFHFFS